MELVEYVFLALGFPMVSFTPHELSLVIKLDMYLNNLTTLDMEALSFGRRLKNLEEQFQKLQSSDSFNLTHFIFEHSIKCQEFFSKCVALVFPLTCCDIFQPVLTSIGLCYTLKPNNDFADLMEKMPLEVPFIMDLISPPHPGKSLEKGFSVFLTHPRELISFFEESEGQKIVPGYTTTISAHLFKRQRTALHTTWHGRSNNCPKLFNNERFTNKMCNAVFTTMNFGNKCNCTSVLQNECVSQVPDFVSEIIKSRLNQKNKTEKTCGPYEMYGCFFSHSLKSNLSYLLENCQEPCIYYGYHSKVTSMSLGGENISRLQIIYNQNQYLYEEYRKATLSSLFSQVGGALGLYLGASIITVAEIVIFMASWIWFKICPIKVKK
ncbi:acid-sensing ion channel 1A-like [Argiope bruennichi]|uniref:acid-sensing ion channel 1A-like n=1 Tax=Argiope bruennichi TaxID=94029 RepID=UPI002495898D|nr:acid-sensing ion channel 1A-like [Argiope bruennichi]